ncbi:MAG TPA: hypothetical protein VGV37_17650 [Aliidongia sp.]|uniref:hypothetical protein n=1 Tax=Aliidongia sp. TaxID=1914230 RepID=UPI002DDDA406|nr:hypothetical protein [Aliidongia sp.]HEV2676355.1 hypothetical protein [Aliidongia sp.]
MHGSFADIKSYTAIQRPVRRATIATPRPAEWPGRGLLPLLGLILAAAAMMLLPLILPIIGLRRVFGRGKGAPVLF